MSWSVLWNSSVEGTCNTINFQELELRDRVGSPEVLCYWEYIGVFPKRLLANRFTIDGIEGKQNSDLSDRF